MQPADNRRLSQLQFGQQTRQLGRRRVRPEVRQQRLAVVEEAAQYRGAEVPLKRSPARVPKYLRQLRDHLALHRTNLLEPGTATRRVHLRDGEQIRGEERRDPLPIDVFRQRTRLAEAGQGRPRPEPDAGRLPGVGGVVPEPTGDRWPVNGVPQSLANHRKVVGLGPGESRQQLVHKMVVDR